MEYSGKSDPARVLPLLWRKRGDQTPIGRTGLTVDAIVAAAIAHADEQGLTDLSMRALARRLGVGAMSLYTHIPGKSELIDLMVDTVWGEIGEPIVTGHGWRTDMEAVAAAMLDLLRRHPWMVYLTETRPVLGPNTIASWNTLLHPLDGIGLSEQEMDRITTLVSGFVASFARREQDLINIERITGESLDTWWVQNEALIERTMVTQHLPVAERVGGAVGAGDLDLGNLREGYHFQLGLILDGVAHLVASRQETHGTA